MFPNNDKVMDLPAQNKVFSTNKTLNLRGQLIDLSTPRIMGILNVTPDSFFDGGKYDTLQTALKHAERMLTEGATFIDVGGYSSRPGAADVSPEDELKRVVPAVGALVKEFPGAFISIDTFRSEVARAAVQEGAVIVNDISGGELDPEMFPTIGRLQVPYVLMHMKGTPQNMHTQTGYEDLVKDIVDYFHRKLRVLHDLQVKDIIIDPGFGFAKTIEQNFQLLDQLEYFQVLEKPLLAGLSRKSMVWKSLGVLPEDALNGTTVLHTLALLKGTSILRVHEVREAVQVIRLLSRCNRY